MSRSNNQVQKYTPSTLPTYQFTTPRNLRYHYIYIPPSTSGSKQSLPPSTSTSKFTILVLHGFPSTPIDFHHQITSLTSQGHGILAPYLLGYHPTSTPLSLDKYRLKLMCEDLIALLDHLDIQGATPVLAHDWGVTLLSRLEYYHPTRVSRMACLAISPTPFGGSFNLDKVNEMTKEMMGYEAYGYQKFFIDDVERAAGILETQHGRMEGLMFSDEKSMRLWREHFGRIGGLERWLSGDCGEENVDRISGVSDELLRVRTQTFVSDDENVRVGNDFGPGYRGPLMWYVGLNKDINIEDERNERSNWEKYKTDKDVLLVLSEKDPIGLPDVQLGMAEGYVEDKQQLRVERLTSGHFVMLERVQELNRLLQQFFAQE